MSIGLCVRFSDQCVRLIHVPFFSRVARLAASLFCLFSSEWRRGKLKAHLLAECEVASSDGRKGDGMPCIPGGRMARHVRL